MGSMVSLTAAGLLWFQIVILLEGADERIESTRPVKLGNLPDVSQVVARPFVQKLTDRYPSRFFVLSRPTDGAGWKITQPGKRAIALVAELLQMLASFSRILACLVRSILIVNRKRGIFLFEHFLHSLAKSHHFHVCQMRQYFADGPAVHRRLPVQLILVRRPDNFFDDNGCLLENWQSWQRVRTR